MSEPREVIAAAVERDYGIAFRPYGIATCALTALAEAGYLVVQPEEFCVRCNVTRPLCRECTSTKEPGGGGG